MIVAASANESNETFFFLVDLWVKFKTRQVVIEGLEDEKKAAVSPPDQTQGQNEKH